MDENYQTTKMIAQRIQDILSINGMSTNRLANQAGIPPSTVYSILNGKCKDVGINTLTLICEYGFGVKLFQFFSDNYRDIRIQKYATGYTDIKKVIRSRTIYKK